MGYMPDFYPLFVAADRCNAKPWEMLEQPMIWRDWALICSTAEAQAQEERSKHPGW